MFSLKYFLIGLILFLLSILILLRELKKIRKNLKEIENTNLNNNNNSNRQFLKTCFKFILDGLFINGLGLLGMIFLYLAILFIGSSFKWW